MKPREIVGRAKTPDGRPVELAREGERYVIRVGGQVLMTSATYGSEQAMATVAAEHIGGRPRARVLIGGLGMGFTLRAALGSFAADARITVAELLEPLVGFNRSVLGDLAGRPLDDPRVGVVVGDVRTQLREQVWDAILLDVDNGPDAITTASNASLYDERGVATIARSLAPGGVIVVWSARPDSKFEARLRRAGLTAETRKVAGRGTLRKGGTHALFVARARDER
jgi:spermidine synthase